MSTPTISPEAGAAGMPLFGSNPLLPPTGGTYNPQQAPMNQMVYHAPAPALPTEIPCATLTTQSKAIPQPTGSRGDNESQAAKQLNVAPTSGGMKIEVTVTRYGAAPTASAEGRHLVYESNRSNATNIVPHISAINPQEHATMQASNGHMDVPKTQYNDAKRIISSVQYEPIYQPQPENTKSTTNVEVIHSAPYTPSHSNSSAHTAQEANGVSLSKVGALLPPDFR